MTRSRRKMNVNSRHIAFLSRGRADIEARLRVGRETPGRQPSLCERWCRLRGNLLFILKKQNSDPEQVLVLERCNVLQVKDNGLLIRFESGEQGWYIELEGQAECVSWCEALREANTERLTNHIRHLKHLLHTHTHPGHAVDTEAKIHSPLEFSLECHGLVAMTARDRLPCALVARGIQCF